MMKEDTGKKLRPKCFGCACDQLILDRWRSMGNFKEAWLGGYAGRQISRASGFDDLFSVEIYGCRRSTVRTTIYRFFILRFHAFFVHSTSRRTHTAALLLRFPFSIIDPCPIRCDWHGNIFETIASGVLLAFRFAKIKISWRLCCYRRRY